MIVKNIKCYWIVSTYSGSIESDDLHSDINDIWWSSYRSTVNCVWLVINAYRFSRCDVRSSCAPKRSIKHHHLLKRLTSLNRKGSLPHWGSVGRFPVVKMTSGYINLYRSYNQKSYRRSKNYTILCFLNLQAYCTVEYSVLCYRINIIQQFYNTVLLGPWN